MVLETKLVLLYFNLLNSYDSHFPDNVPAERENKANSAKVVDGLENCRYIPYRADSNRAIASSLNAP